jgi:lipid-A-disaccharide synthase
LAKLFVKIKFISLVNLICKKEVIKEFIQSEVNEKNLKNEINNILNGKDIEIKKNYKLLRNLIGLDGVSKRVAIHIINN